MCLLGAARLYAAYPVPRKFACAGGKMARNGVVLSAQVFTAPSCPCKTPGNKKTASFLTVSTPKPITGNRDSPAEPTPRRRRFHPVF